MKNAPALDALAVYRACTAQEALQQVEVMIGSGK
jgi:hypothetical protein